MLFRALGAQFPFWPAACISGFLFAIGHGELVVILPITLLGIAFAFLNRKTGNLWSSAAAHGVFNALASVASLLVAWAMHGPGS
jgi:membrane protease YdiL (CAAX protease family)